MPISDAQSARPRLRFSVLGAGSIGKRHLRNLLALGHTVAAVYDPDPQRRNEVSRTFGLTVVETLEAALGGALDAVLVCSPTIHHLDQATAAIQAGLHVFIEKPLAASVEGTERFADLVARSGRVALTGCNLRFCPSLVRTKQSIVAGDIGKPLWARAEFGFYLPFWHPWEDYRRTYSARKDLGGGVLLDAIHELDYLTWVMGEVTEVTGFLANIGGLGIETEDLADVTLAFVGGATGQMHIDYLQRRFCRTLKVVGDGGVIHWDYVAQTVQLHTESTRGETWEEGVNADRNAMYIAELNHFVDCIRGVEVPVLDVVATRRLLEVIEAVRASGREKRTIPVAPTREVRT